MFWPEGDAEQPRHALRQSLYFLRRSLGPGVLVSRGDDELGIADGGCCDAVKFGRAIDASRLENRTGDSMLNPIGVIADRLDDPGTERIRFDPRHGLAHGNAVGWNHPLTIAQLADASGARFVIAEAYYKEGDSLRFMARLADAMTDGRQWLPWPELRSQMAMLLASPGDSSRWIRYQVLASSAELLAERARVAALRGSGDEAIELLHQAFAHNKAFDAYVHTDPSFETLWSDVRFNRLLVTPDGARHF